MKEDYLEIVKPLYSSTTYSEQDSYKFFPEINSIIKINNILSVSLKKNYKICYNDPDTFYIQIEYINSTSVKNIDFETDEELAKEFLKNIQLVLPVIKN